MLAFGCPLQRALALSVLVGVGSLLLQLVLWIWRFPGTSPAQTTGDDKVQLQNTEGGAPEIISRATKKGDDHNSESCGGLSARAPVWSTAPKTSPHPAAPLHLDQHFVQPRALRLQDLWSCKPCSAPSAIGRVTTPGLQQPPDPHPTAGTPTPARSTPKCSGDGSQPLASATPSAHITGALSSKHAVAGSAPDNPNGAASVLDVVGGTLPLDTACRPDTTSSAYDTARALVSQAWTQSYTPMYTLGRIALKIPDRNPSDLPPATVWTRPYCEALEGEGIALVGAYVRQGCIHIVLDFLDLAVSPGGTGGSGPQYHHNPYALRHGRHLLGTERGERNCSSGGSSRSASRSNSRRRSGRFPAWVEQEGAAVATGIAAAAAGLPTHTGGRASAPGDLLPLAAPVGELQQYQHARQRQLQLRRRNAPARVMSANAAAAGFAPRNTTVLSRNATAAAGGGADVGAQVDDDDDDDHDSSSGAAAAARPRLHPLSARRLRRLRRASVPSLPSGPPQLQGTPGVATDAAIAGPSPSAHGGDGAPPPLTPALSPSASSVMSSMRLPDNAVHGAALTPELLVELLGPGIGGGGQTVTVQLPIGGGAWSVQMLQSGPAAASVAPSAPPPDLTCISPPCVLAGAPGPVVLYAAGTDLQGVTANYGATGSEGAAPSGGTAGGAAGGGALTVHVRFRGAYQPCRASLLGDQMPAEALSRVLPLDALRRAEVLCLQLAVPPQQPGLMFVECQRGGLLGAALPVLVVPNEGVWQEVTALQGAAIQEGGGQIASAQRLVTDLGLWLDYLHNAPSQQQQQLQPPPQQQPSPLLSAPPQRPQPRPIPPAEPGCLPQPQPSLQPSRETDPRAAAEPSQVSAAGSPCPTDGVSVIAAGVPPRAIEAGGDAFGGRVPGLGRLFGRSLLRLLCDAEQAESVATQPPPQLPPQPPMQRQEQRQEQRQGGLRLLEDMLTVAEQELSRQEQRPQPRCPVPVKGGPLHCEAGADFGVAAAAASNASGEEDMAARLNRLAPDVGVAYGSSPGPNTDGDGGCGVEAAGLGGYIRAISDPQTRREGGTGASAPGEVEADGDAADAMEAAGARLAFRAPIAGAHASPARSRIAGSGSDDASVGGTIGGCGDGCGGGNTTFAALRQHLQVSGEASQRKGASVGLEGPDSRPSDWQVSFSASSFDSDGLTDKSSKDGPRPSGAAATAATTGAADGAATGGSRGSSCGLSLAALPPPPHAQSLYNGRWQLPSPPSSRAEKAVGSAQQDEQIVGCRTDLAAAPAAPAAQTSFPVTPTQSSGSSGGSGGGGVPSCALEASEASGCVSVVSADLLALGPAEAATLSMALLSFGPIGVRGGAASGSLNLPPVRTDSSATELHSWDSLTEVALAAVSATPLSSSTAALSRSPSPCPSLQLHGDGARMRPLGSGAAAAAAAAVLAGSRRGGDEREARPRPDGMACTEAAATAAETSRPGITLPQLQPASPPSEPRQAVASETQADGKARDGVVARVDSAGGPAGAVAEAAAGITANAAAPDAVEAKLRNIALSNAPLETSTACSLEITATMSAATPPLAEDLAAAAAAVTGNGFPPPGEPAATEAAAAAPPHVDDDACPLPLGACWPAAGGSDASARLNARMRHLGLGLLAFSLRRGWVATTEELLSGLARVGVSLADADAGLAAREGGMGLLHLAVTARKPALLRALPKAAAAAAAASGAAFGEFVWDVGARGPMGMTPLHLATALDDGGEVAALLLEAFPDAPVLWFTAADNSGCTPAEMAAQARLEAVSDLARDLLLRGDGAATRQLPLSPPQRPPQQELLVQMGQLQEWNQLQHDLQAHGLHLRQQQQQLTLGPGRGNDSAAVTAAAASHVAGAAAIVAFIAGEGGGVDCRTIEAAATTVAPAASSFLAPEAASTAAAGSAVTKLNRWLVDFIRPPAQLRQQRPQRRASWLRISLTGFDDPQVEAQYQTFRAASLGVVDRTCGLVFLFLFLLPALYLMRQRRGAELASHCLFNVGLLGPYVLAIAAPAAFRRHRDAALMTTDVLKATLVVLALLRVLSLPRAWADFARGHMDVLMLVVMKPLAEQIRVRAALLQRAAAVFSDTHIYASVLYGGAVVPALARAVLQNVAALVLLLVLDIRARLRFHQALANAAAATEAATDASSLDKDAAAASIASNT